MLTTINARFLFVGLLGLTLCPLGGAEEEGKADTPPAQAIERPALAMRLSGPFTHENLTIFLIHGDDQLKGRKFLTLDEALEQKKVVVHETKNVNQLAIENVSDEEVFVQAGSIVKGGQQDRLLAVDMIVPAKSGRLPIDSFCVESGRWRAREGNSVDKFDSAKTTVPSKDIQLAARQAASQDKVWERCAETQMKLCKSVGADVKSPQSATSLQLTVEHKKLLDMVAAYEKALKGTLDRKDDVIGFAIAVNGKMFSADVYASHDLFIKLWPKLLQAAAVEAVGEVQKDKKFEPMTLDGAKSFLAEAEKGKRSDKSINKRLTQVRQDGEKNMLIETIEGQKQGAVLRRCYIAY